MSKRRPSAAMIVAVIALVLGLGGAAIAADLTKPQVKKIAKKAANKQIKKKALLKKNEANLNVNSAKTAANVDTVKPFAFNLTEGQEVTLFTHGPLSAVAQCLDGGANDQAVIVRARTTEAGSAYSDQNDSVVGFGPADTDERIQDFDAYTGGAPTEDISSAEDDQFSMFAPSGPVLTGSVSSYANETTQSCVVWGNVILSR